MSRELLYLQEVGANDKGFSWTVVLWYYISIVPVSYTHLTLPTNREV